MRNLLIWGENESFILIYPCSHVNSQSIILCLAENVLLAPSYKLGLRFNPLLGL